MCTSSLLRCPFDISADELDQVGIRILDCCEGGASGGFSRPHVGNFVSNLRPRHKYRLMGLFDHRHNERNGTEGQYFEASS